MWKQYAGGGDELRRVAYVAILIANPILTVIFKSFPLAYIFKDGEEKTEKKTPEV